MTSGVRFELRVRVQQCRLEFACKDSRDPAGQFHAADSIPFDVNATPSHTTVTESSVKPRLMAATAAAQEHEPEPAGTPPPRSQIRSLMQDLFKACTKCTLVRCGSIAVEHNGELIEADPTVAVAQAPRDLGIERVPTTPSVHHDEIVAVCMHLYEPKGHGPILIGYFGCGCRRTWRAPHVSGPVVIRPS